MIKGLLDLHNLLRWVLLLLLLVSIIKAFTGWQQKKVFSPGDKRVWLFTLIAAHIQLLIGLYQMIAGRYGIIHGMQSEPMSLMKNTFYRFYWVEHPLLMIISIVLITVAHGMAKKPFPDVMKYRRAFWLFVVALLLILASIPWPFRTGDIARSLLPGMG